MCVTWSNYRPKQSLNAIIEDKEAPADDCQWKKNMFKTLEKSFCSRRLLTLSQTSSLFLPLLLSDEASLPLSVSTFGSKKKKEEVAAAAAAVVAGLK